MSGGEPTDDLVDVASDAVTDSLDAFGLSIGLDADIFHTVNQAAVDWASEHAADLITLISDSTRDFVRGSVVRAFEGGWSTQQLKQDIADGYTFSNDRALMIARSEVTDAANQGGLLAARAAAMDRKSWIATDDACSDCQDNEDAGDIDIDEEFPSGDDAPGAHPNCRCSMSYSAAEADSTDEAE